MRQETVDKLIDALRQEASEDVIANLQRQSRFWRAVEEETAKQLRGAWFFFTKDNDGVPELYVCPKDSDIESVVKVNFLAMIERELNEDTDHIQFIADTFEAALVKLRAALASKSKTTVSK